MNLQLGHGIPLYFFNCIVTYICSNDFNRYVVQTRMKQVVVCVTVSLLVALERTTSSSPSVTSQKMNRSMVRTPQA